MSRRRIAAFTAPIQIIGRAHGRIPLHLTYGTVTPYEFTPDLPHD